MIRRLALPATVLLLTTAAFILTKAARDSLYFEGGAWLQLPWAYLGIAALAWPVAMTAVTAMRGIGPRRTRILILAVVALFNLLLAAAARPGGGILMTGAFIAIPLFYGVLLSTGWLLGAESLEGTDISRPDAYGFLGSASMAGGVAGALIARGMGPATGPNAMFAAGSVVLGLAAVTVHRTQARHSGAAGTGRPGPRRLPPMRLRGLAAEPYTLWLLALAGVGSAVGIFIEFQFYLAATRVAVDQQGRTDFFSGFYVVFMLTALTLQLVMVPWVQRRLGVRGSLMILPIALLGAAGAFVFGSGAGGQSAMRVAEGSLRSSIHRSNWEQVYLPFESGLRDVARLFVDGMGARFAEGAAAIAILIWIGTRSPPEIQNAAAGWVPYTIVVGAVVWVVTLRLLRLPAQCEDRSSGAPRVPESCVMTSTLGKCLLEESPETMEWDES